HREACPSPSFASDLRACGAGSRPQGSPRKEMPMAHEPTIQDQFHPRDEALAAFSTAIAGLYYEHFGKGPTKAKTYALDDVVICVLHDGLTRVEKTLFGRGRGEGVREMRSAFQDAVADRFTSAVEDATGRRVIAFM